jgi:anaerobic selenocysteine-containing dehydrogenase
MEPWHQKRTYTFETNAESNDASTMTGNPRTTKYRICPLCETTCGLEIGIEADRVTSVRGDRADVFSAGFVCPKGAALIQLHNDPDRLRQPLVRRDGELQAASWDEAFAEIERRLVPIIGERGKDAVAVYLGNPNVHNFGLALYGQALLRALRTANIYSASTVDQMPKQLASGLMFGNFLSIAVPDIDRTDYLLVLGANPFESNGSLWTVPDFPGRLRALRQRGGRCVVIDPRRTRTAEAADEHVFIRPGTDAHLLLAMVNVLFAEGRVDLGRLTEHVRGTDLIEQAAREFTPEIATDKCGVPAETIRRLARELSAVRCGAVYGRIGTCTQEFGTVASWLIDVCNVLTGNLDRVGGAMFPKAAAFQSNSYGAPGVGRGVRTGRRRSRVRGAAEVMGELPVACLAEEIETLGEGQVRALITIAGNPVLSTPNAGRLDAALATLEFMVSLDVYVNETTRHADVILPGLSPLFIQHFDAAFPQFGYRNAVRYSPPVFTPPPDRPAEWQTLLRLTGIVTGQGANPDLDALDDFVATSQIQRAVADEHSSVCGRDGGEIFAALEGRRGPDRLLDLALRTGPWGDGFGAHADGLTLAKLETHPHGIDLGPLEPRIPEVLRTPSGKIELAPEALTADARRVRESASAPLSDELRLVGRRHLRSNNSWMHNLPLLAGGRPRCTLQMHPLDARRLGLADGSRARVTSRAGTLELPVELDEGIMPGVVSIPHGWGHDRPGARLRLAAEDPGVNSNVLADELALDPLSGNAVLNGIPVRVEALAA